MNAEMFKSLIARRVRFSKYVVVPWKTICLMFPAPRRLSTADMAAQISEALDGIHPITLGKSQEQQIQEWCSENCFEFRLDEMNDRAAFRLRKRTEEEILEIVFS